MEELYDYETTHENYLIMDTAVINKLLAVPSIAIEFREMTANFEPFIVSKQVDNCSLIHALIFRDKTDRNKAFYLIDNFSQKIDYKEQFFYRGEYITEDMILDLRKNGNINEFRDMYIENQVF